LQSAPASIAGARLARLSVGVDVRTARLGHRRLTIHETSNTHCYLAAAVESVVPHKMPDVLMEGVRLKGRSAQLFLTAAGANDIVTLADKMALIGCASLAPEDL